MPPLKIEEPFSQAIIYKKETIILQKSKSENFFRRGFYQKNNKDKDMQKICFLSNLDIRKCLDSRKMKGTTK